MVKILERIKQLCKENGISIAGLEKGAGLANGVIDDWDTSSPRLSSLQKIASYLNIPLTDLLADTDQ